MLIVLLLKGSSVNSFFVGEVAIGLRLAALAAMMEARSLAPGSAIPP